MTRARMSRPSSSVPNQCAADGPFERARRGPAPSGSIGRSVREERRERQTPRGTAAPSSAPCAATSIAAKRSDHAGRTHGAALHAARLAGGPLADRRAGMMAGAARSAAPG